MTVTYTHDVATCNRFGTFWKLLFRWRGSIYKLVWPELFVYSFLYCICNIMYRFLLDEPHKRTFEKVSLYCQQFTDLIPVSFVLGFYVSIVVTRWWNQYESLPWPDSLALFISTSIHGQDERGRVMRRTIMRYCNLALLFTFIMISPGVKKRFPTIDHLVEAGFMTANEQKIFDDLDTKTPHSKYWMPLVWAGSIVARARKEGRIRDDFAVKTIIDEINRFRGLCGGLLSYDWISVPLVYTQVVTLAVYTFFIGTIMGRQFLDPKQGIPQQDIDFYFPVFTVLQFFFYMGWLKVAESLVNPFGEDDDDFEVNWLVDRNLQVSYLIVDEMHNEHPELIQDKYWDEIFPIELPYTIAAEQFKIDPPQGSTANVEVPEVEQEFLPLVEEVDEDEGITSAMSDLGQEMENGETKVINIKTGDSRRSSTSGRGSPLQSASGRKSVLSQIVQRMKFGSSDNLRQRKIQPVASSASIRTGKRHRGFNRSASRVSSTSHATSQSRDSVPRNPTILTQGSGIFHMSDLSLSTAGHDDLISPRTRGGIHSHDEDEPIHIKIKRRDQDGRVIKSPSSDEFEFESESSRADLIPRRKKSSSRTFKREHGSEEASDGKAVRPSQVDNRSLASSCSIRTSIFQGDEEEEEEEIYLDDEDDDKISAQVEAKKKQGVMKSLKGAFNKIRGHSHEPTELSKTAAAAAASYTLSKWLSSETAKEDKSEEEELHIEEDKSVRSSCGDSYSLPVSPIHKSSPGYSRKTKSAAVSPTHKSSPVHSRNTKSAAGGEADSVSYDLASLLEELPSPANKSHISATSTDAKVPIIEVSSPANPTVSRLPVPPFSPQKLVGETRIDMAKNTEQETESEKTSVDAIPGEKFSTLSEPELEPIPEDEDSSGKNDKELWV